MTSITPPGLPTSSELKMLRGADPHGVVLALRGEVDLGSAPELERELREIGQAGPRRIVIDLRELDFMDCTGISVIIRAQQSAHANEHLLALRRGPHQVQRLFELTGLGDRFEWLD